VSPAISLIIVARDAEPYVGAAVSTALLQTRGDFELVVWDDGSTDRTSEVALEASDGDPRVRVMREPHRGPAAAINAAARRVQGRYIGWLDGDAALAPMALEHTAGVLDREPAFGMVFTQYQTVDAAWQVGDLGMRCRIPYSAQRLLVDFMTCQFRLMRRDLFDRVGGVDETLRYGHEYDLCLKMAENGEIRAVTRSLYFHRVYDRVRSVADGLAAISEDREIIRRALARRGLGEAFDVDVDIQSRFELRKREDESPT
jgi:glycosyltransferase involved in cell wall biosynthesis